MSPRSPRCDKLLIRFFCREEIEGFRSWSSKITFNFRLSSPPPPLSGKRKIKTLLLETRAIILVIIVGRKLNYGHRCFDFFSNSSPPLLKRDLFPVLERCRTKKKKKKRKKRIVFPFAITIVSFARAINRVYSI